jgi:hypothetical protein
MQIYFFIEIVESKFAKKHFKIVSTVFFNEVPIQCR